MVEKTSSIAKFRKAIQHLPEDPRKVRPGVWYTTQKEHWLGWLEGYSGPGAYGRKNWNRDAKFVYNHVVFPELHLYLIRAIPLESDLVVEAEEAEKNGKSPMEKSGAIRRVVPWQKIYRSLWEK